MSFQVLNLPQSPSKVQTGHMFPSLPKLLQKHAKNYPRVRSQGHFGGWDICCNVGTKDCQHSSAAGRKPQGYSKWLASKSRDLAESSYTKANNVNFFRQESPNTKPPCTFTNRAKVLQKEELNWCSKCQVQKGK